MTIASLSGLNQNPYSLNALKLRYYSVATTSTSGAPTSTVVVAGRGKYLGGWYVPNQIAGTSTNVTGFDVMTITQATSVSSGLVTAVTSGVGVTTSTGTLAIPFGPIFTPSNTAAVYLAAGDVIFTAASTGVGGFITHIVQEF